MPPTHSFFLISFSWHFVFAVVVAVLSEKLNEFLIGVKLRAAGRLVGRCICS